MLHYSDGGPGPTFKLVRVHAPKDGTFEQWSNAPAQRWNPGGWYDFPQAQDQILNSGELFLVDDSEVPEIQAQVAAHYQPVAG